MYEEFYGFTEKPFSLLPDADFLYMGEKHSTAYAMLEYGLMNQAGFTVITGEVGSGKTTLVRKLLDDLHDDVTIGLISNTPQNIGQLLQWVLMAFDQDYREENQVALYDQFNQFLIDQYSNNKRTVLIIDEAQNLHPHILEELRMLSNINADKHQILQIILVGQPQLLALLKEPTLEQFRQRIASDYYLKSLDRTETGRYINHRTFHAGVERSLFEEKAVNLIFQASKGIPRVINVLCDMALVYGYAEQLQQIDEAIVQAVLDDKASSGLIELENTAATGIPQPSTTQKNSEFVPDERDFQDLKQGNSSKIKSDQPKLSSEVVKHLFSKE